MTRVDELPRPVDRRAVAPGDRTAARGHALAVRGLECLEEQLRRLRAADASVMGDRDARHARRADGVAPSGLNLRAGGMRI